LANQPVFALTTANAAAVAQVCRRLDGIPLAIELAAARVKALPVEKINERLDDRFRLLTGGSRVALPRQQTLQALIDWSYNLLSPSEQTLLRCLSVFAGGFSLEAAEAVCAGDGIEDWEVLDRLTSLVEKSLVQYDEHEGGEARYRLLETVLHYARDRLEERGEARSVRGRHPDWFVSLAERAAPELRRWNQLVWLDRLQAEHDNLRAAMQSCGSDANGTEAALRLATALEGFWIPRGFWREGRQFLEAALAQGIDAPPALRARALTALAQLARFTGDFTLLASSAQEGLDRAQAADDQWAIARSLFLLGIHAGEMADRQHAAELGEQSHAIAQEVGDPWLIAQALFLRAMPAWMRGEKEQAMRWLEEGLTLMRSVGDRSILTILLGALANLSLRQKRFDQAVVYSKEAIRYCRELGDLRGTAWAVFFFGAVAVAQGQAERAGRLLAAVASMLEELGHRLPPGFQAWYDETVALARTALGEEAFAVAWAEGRAMPLEQVLEYALERSGDVLAAGS
jgi:non-specific serine/threonine protein kinase